MAKFDLPNGVDIGSFTVSKTEPFIVENTVFYLFYLLVFPFLMRLIAYRSSF